MASRMRLIYMLPGLFLVLLAGCSAASSTGGGGGDGDASSSVDTTNVTPDAEIPPADSGCRQGTPCDDGDPCTADDRCAADGSCSGEAYTCQADPACATATCRGDGTCTVEVVSGKCHIDGKCFADGQSSGPGDTCFLCDAGADPRAFTVATGADCNDGDPCTMEDSCGGDGACTGEPVLCDDDNPCTFDACSATTGICTHEAVTVPCEDGDACTEGDTCAGGSCQAGSPRVCPSDGDACTDEVCDPATGCASAAVDCDDDSPCTNDSCDAAKGCVHEKIADGEPCDDGDVCSTEEACKDGLCVAAGSVDCDDANPCTNDSCDPDKGCLHIFHSDSCDDGFDCTFDDFCSAGACSGQKTTACPICDPEMSPHGAKVTSLSIPSGGHPGSGLDLDGDPGTCSPPGDCSGGVDNALGILGSLVNTPFQDAFDAGTLMYLVEMDGLNFSGVPFTMRIFIGDVAPSVPPCDFQHATCNYWVAKADFDPECNVGIEFDNTTLDAEGNLKAGGLGYIFVVKGTLIGGYKITFVTFNAAVEGKVTKGLLPDGTETVQTLNGIIGGAVPKQIIKDTLTELPDALIPSTIKKAVIQFIENDIQNDLDMDGDGNPDAASIAMRFITIPAVLLGVNP